jgi:hypothetical protein
VDDLQPQQQRQRFGDDQLALGVVDTGTGQTVVRWRQSIASTAESSVARLRKLVADGSGCNHAIGGCQIDVIERKQQAVPSR